MVLTPAAPVLVSPASLVSLYQALNVVLLSPHVPPITLLVVVQDVPLDSPYHPPLNAVLPSPHAPLIALLVDAQDVPLDLPYLLTHVALIF